MHNTILFLQLLCYNIFYIFFSCILRNLDNYVIL